MLKNMLIILMLLLLSGSILQPALAVNFDLTEGTHYHYKITMQLVQDNTFTSTDNFTSDSGQLSLTAEYTLYESIEVLEYIDNEYARIVCQYDSLEGVITSGTGQLTRTIRLKSLRDSIEIWQADSLTAVYSPGSSSDQAAIEYYEKLLFIGEPIEMLVYPGGEIISINENENLWEQAGDFIGFDRNSFMQVRLPTDNPALRSWNQSIEIDKLGKIKLKNRLDPLEVAYSITPQKNKIDFAGKLNLSNYISPASLTSLSDEYRLSIDELRLSQSGSILYCGQNIRIEHMFYRTSLEGNIVLAGENGKKYQTALKFSSYCQAEYELLDNCPD